MTEVSIIILLYCVLFSVSRRGSVSSGPKYRYVPATQIVRTWEKPKEGSLGILSVTPRFCCAAELRVGQWKRETYNYEVWGRPDITSARWELREGQIVASLLSGDRLVQQEVIRPRVLA